MSSDTFSIFGYQRYWAGAIAVQLGKIWECQMSIMDVRKTVQLSVRIGCEYVTVAITSTFVKRTVTPV